MTRQGPNVFFFVDLQPIIDKTIAFIIKQADGDDQFIVRGLTVVRQRHLQRFRDFFLATPTLKVSV